MRSFACGQQFNSKHPNLYLGNNYYCFAQIVQLSQLFY